MDEEEEVEAEVEEGDKVRSALFPNREWFPSPNCFSFSVVPTKFQRVHQGTKAQFNSGLIHHRIWILLK